MSDIAKNSKERIFSLDCFKAFAAFWVVVGHSPAIWNDISNPRIYIVTPFFLVVSGYFLFSNNVDTIKSRIKKILPKTIKITLIANIVYYLYRLISSFIIYGTITPPFFHINDFIIWAIFGFNFGGHLWYLTAYIWALVIIYVTYQLNIQKCLYVFLLSFLVFNFLIPYNIIDINLAWHYEVNFISVSLPWLIVGMLIRRYENMLNKILPTKYLVGIFIVALIARYIEKFIFITPNPRALFNVLVLPCLFLILLRHKAWGKDSAIYNIGHAHTQNIYIWHMLIIMIITHLRSVGINVCPNYIFAPLVYCIAIIVSICIKQIPRQKKLTSSAPN